MPLTFCRALERGKTTRLLHPSASLQAIWHGLAMWLLQKWYLHPGPCHATCRDAKEQSGLQLPNMSSRDLQKVTGDGVGENMRPRGVRKQA